MKNVKAVPPGDKAARVVRSKLTAAQKRAAVRAATTRVRTSVQLDFVCSVRGG
jgi:hypothetical protein